MSDVGEIVEEDDIRSVNNLGDVGNIELDYNGDICDVNNVNATVELDIDNNIIICKEILTNNAIANAVTTKITVKINENEIYSYIQISKYTVDKIFIGNILVDLNSYEKMRKYNWYISILEGGYKRVLGEMSIKSIVLSHFIYGKPAKKNVIDHLNINSLDNRDRNLREISKPHNGQNRNKLITERTTSKFIGVCFDKREKKWMVQYANKFLGYFEIEEEAGKMYDKYVLLLIGKLAKTNNLCKYEEVLNISINDILPKKIIRNLPKNIYYNDTYKSFRTQISYNKKSYSKGGFENIENAIKQLEIFKKEIENIKLNESNTHYAKEIKRNKNGDAILDIYNINNELIDYAIVDDNNWHDLSKQSWYLSNKYIVGTIN
jgi:hypothetical protein